LRSASGVDGVRACQRRGEQSKGGLNKWNPFITSIRACITSGHTAKSVLSAEGFPERGPGVVSEIVRIGAGSGGGPSHGLGPEGRPGVGAWPWNQRVNVQKPCHSRYVIQQLCEGEMSRMVERGSDRSCSAAPLRPSEVGSGRYFTPEGEPTESEGVPYHPGTPAGAGASFQPCLAPSPVLPAPRPLYPDAPAGSLSHASRSPSRTSSMPFLRCLRPRTPLAILADAGARYTAYVRTSSDFTPPSF
jgi:hypothetical protein